MSKGTLAVLQVPSHAALDLIVDLFCEVLLSSSSSTSSHNQLRDITELSDTDFATF